MSNPPVDPSEQGTPQAPVAEVAGTTAQREEGYTQAIPSWPRIQGARIPLGVTSSFGSECACLKMQ